MFLLLALAFPVRSLAADLAGWDRTRWGMSSSEIAALYGTQVTHLPAPIEFAGLYASLVLRHTSFAELDFTIYFQMSIATHRLAQVLLERQRQRASLRAWRATTEALERAFGSPAASCKQSGAPLEGTPLVLERVWVMPTTTVRATFLDFGPFVPSDRWRRLLVRYTPTRPGQVTCQE